MWTRDGAMVRDTTCWRKNWESSNVGYTSKYKVFEWNTPGNVRIHWIKVASLMKTLLTNPDPSPSSVCVQALVIVPQGANSGEPGDLGLTIGTDKFYLGPQEQIVWFDVMIAKRDGPSNKIARKGFKTEEELSYILQVSPGDSLWFIAENDSSNTEIVCEWEGTATIKWDIIY